MKTQPDVLINLPASSKPVFDVVMVYDEFASGRQAMETYHQLTSQSQNQFEFQLREWRMGLLRNQTLNEIAAREAADAKVVIVATTCEELPVEVKHWIDGWRTHKCGARCVLAMILNGPARTTDLEDYLRLAAAECGREFLVEKIAPTPDGRSINNYSFVNKLKM